MPKKINYKNKEYNIEVIKKNNKNTYIRVKDDKIIITTNYLVSSFTLNKLINDNYNAITSLIDKSIKKEAKKEQFYLFGDKYDVIYGSFTNVDITNNKIYVKDKQTLDKYIDKKVKAIFKERLDYWTNIYKENIPVPNLKIRTMKTRWGVCNIKNHNVTLNKLLYRYDIRCLDYVIVHELSHFIHPNHSKEFWNQVSKYYPNYKEVRKILKE